MHSWYIFNSLIHLKTVLTLHGIDSHCCVYLTILVKEDTTLRNNRWQNQSEVTSSMNIFKNLFHSWSQTHHTPVSCERQLDAKYVLLMYLGIEHLTEPVFLLKILYYANRRASHQTAVTSIINKPQDCK